MKQARAELMKDAPVIGEGMPMVSASGKPIDIGDAIYTLQRFDCYPDEDDDDKSLSHELEESVTAHRVIQLNYKYRYDRLRCGNGCESTIHFGQDACSRITPYHSLEDIKRIMQKRISDACQTLRDKQAVELEKCELKLRSAARLSALVDKVSVEVPEFVE